MNFFSPDSIFVRLMTVVGDVNTAMYTLMGVCFSIANSASYFKNRGNGDFTQITHTFFSNTANGCTGHKPIQ